MPLNLWYTSRFSSVSLMFPIGVVFFLFFFMMQF